MGISSRDYAISWSPARPVRVDFRDGTTAYVSLDAAVERLDEGAWDTSTRDRLQRGDIVTRWTGTRYQLVQELELRALDGDR